MRRKEKEIHDLEEITTIIENASVCRIAMCHNNEPYIVPVNYGIDGNILYIHSAPEGKKIDILKKNNYVCIEIDIKHEIEIQKRPCSSSSKYKSVIALGKAHFIDDIVEKKKALNLILDHYSAEVPYEFREKQLERVMIIKIELEEITGKKSGYE